ncbi:MAG: hypothetical protein M3443_02505 [Actinomycetota bacterium]|nr:hypothetical protein [Actinomycetota bacterium]
MSGEKVAAELRRVLFLLDLSTLAQALEFIGHAERALAHAIQGSQRPEAEQAVALLGHVQQQLGEVYQTIHAVLGLVEQYVTRITGGGATAPVTTAPSMPTVSRTITSAVNDKQRTVSDIIASLPPEVPKPNPTGKKTYGKVVGSAEVITSGVDAESAEVWQRLIDGGLVPRKKPMAIHHVEMKVALRMIKSSSTEVELILNNQPCRGFLSCDKLLSVLLPDGYTLTVYGPNYKGVFKGGKKWSS